MENSSTLFKEPLCIFGSFEWVCLDHHILFTVYVKMSLKNIYPIWQSIPGVLQHKSFNALSLIRYATSPGMSTNEMAQRTNSVDFNRPA